MADTINGLGGDPSPGMTLRKGVNRNMLNEIKHFATSLMTRVMIAKEEGQALVEYALILALVAVALVAALGLLAGGIENEFKIVIEKL
jgi:pilus assembly protein Flp/PilA